MFRKIIVALLALGLFMSACPPDFAFAKEKQVKEKKVKKEKKAKKPKKEKDPFAKKTRVKSYSKRDGTHVDSHMRTVPGK